MKKYLFRLSVLFLLGSLLGCGQTGRLYLPANTPTCCGPTH